MTNLRRMCALGVLCFMGGTALAEAPKSKKDESKGAQPAAMMAAMEKANAIGEQHKKLQGMAGTWATTTKMWMAPGAAPMETQGTAEVKPILGGRYVEEHFSSTVMGKPFEGIATIGYDNGKKMYISTWVDSMGTGIMVSTGSTDPTGKVMTSVGSETDPVTGQEKHMKMVDTWSGDKKHVAEFYSKGPDGKDMKTMEIVYSKK